MSERGVPGHHEQIETSPYEGTPDLSALANRRQGRIDAVSVADLLRNACIRIRSGRCEAGDPVSTPTDMREDELPLPVPERDRTAIAAAIPKPRD
jgi:hypothetical protein